MDENKIFNYTRIFSIFIIVIISSFLIDFYCIKEVKKLELFKEFDCVNNSSYRGIGKGNICYLNCQSGQKIYLPNNINFEENFKKGDKLTLVETGFFGFRKKFYFKNHESIIVVKISDFYSIVINSILFFSLAFYSFYFFLSRYTLLQALFTVFTIIDVLILFFYFYLH